MLRVFFIVLAFIAPEVASGQEVFRAEQAIGGRAYAILVVADGQSQADHLLDIAFGAMTDADGRLVHLDSVLTRGGAPPSPQDFRLINRVLGWARMSGGAFDPTRSDSLGAWRATQVDLLRSDVQLPRGAHFTSAEFRAGVVLEAGAQALMDASVSSALLSADHRLYRALDAPPESGGWRINVDDPSDGGEYGTTVRLIQGALALTQGPQVDRRTAAETQAVITVAVRTADAVDAEALGLALYVLGPEQSSAILSGTPGAQARFIVEGAEGPELHAVRWSEAGN